MRAPYAYVWPSLSTETRVVGDAAADNGKRNCCSPRPTSKSQGATAGTIPKPSHRADCFATHANTSSTAQLCAAPPTRMLRGCPAAARLQAAVLDGRGRELLLSVCEWGLFVWFGGLGVVRVERKRDLRNEGCGWLPRCTLLGVKPPFSCTYFILTNRNAISCATHPLPRSNPSTQNSHACAYVRKCAE